MGQLNPFAGGPAERCAEIQIGDILIAIDDEAVENLTIGDKREKFLCIFIFLL